MTLDAGGKDTFLRSVSSTIQSATCCSVEHPDISPSPHLCDSVPAFLRIWMPKDSFPPASSVMWPSPPCPCRQSTMPRHAPGPPAYCRRAVMVPQAATPGTTGHIFVVPPWDQEALSVVPPWDHTPVLWDHTGRFCGTTRGARTKPVVPAWSLVSHGKSGLWDHRGPTPLSWGRDHGWSWDHSTVGPRMVPAPRRGGPAPRAATGHRVGGPGCAHSRLRNVRATRSPGVALLDGSGKNTAAGSARTTARRPERLHHRPPRHLCPASPHEHLSAAYAMGGRGECVVQAPLASS